MTNQSLSDPLTLDKSQPQWVVAKFGGTSVSTVDCWHNIVTIIHQHLTQDCRVLVVCSAPATVSNKLNDLATAALTNQHAPILAELHNIYMTLGAALAIDAAVLLQEEFARLQQLAEGIALLQEVTPRIKAQIMAFGEFTLTRLGASYLMAQQLDVIWHDVKMLLQAEADPNQSSAGAYLAARCQATADPVMRQQLNQLNHQVVLTQGFVAGNSRGETVLLGRGGSDVSAAYLAAKISAVCCEIWTDVPGVYTANPHHIPQARLLKHLDYDEAQEIASMGGKVLHPNCIAPCKEQRIPLFVKYTAQPQRAGTEISLRTEMAPTHIKSIINKYGVLLIAIETMRMWRQVGFLARIFSCFKQHGISIDLISTSESNVTVSLDLTADAQDLQQIEALLADLNQFARATTIGPCAAISLVGHDIRAILPKIGSVLDVFAQQKVHLLSQAANDLNLTFVVNEDQAQRLTQRLHTLLIEDHLVSHYFGRSWQQEFVPAEAPVDQPWWHMGQQALLELVHAERSALYVYAEEALDKNVQALQACTALDKIYYALKANPYPSILQRFYQAGLGFECVSWQEVVHIFTLFPYISPHRVLFTPNFAPREEYERALAYNIHVTIDSLYPLQHWPELFANRDIIVRIDPGQGYGHHKYVCTGGSDSKFGIALAELETLLQLTQTLKCRVVGLHAHSGSGILRAQTWQENSRVLTNLLTYFPDVQVINIGGGLGIVEKPGQKPLDLSLFNESLLQVKAAFPNIQLWLEPGRFLVASAGVLLARVTQVKTKNDVLFVGIETGMNSLIRPALYGAYHDIVNLTRLHAEGEQLAHVVGPICESGDTLGYSRLLPKTNEGDVLLIANSGAYGHCMSSYYNMRSPAKEYYWSHAARQPVSTPLPASVSNAL